MEKSCAPSRTPSLQGMPSRPPKNSLNHQPGSSPRPTRWLLPGGWPSPHPGVILEVLPLPEITLGGPARTTPGPWRDSPRNY